MYYGQFETDKFISEYFPANYVGACVEVGASHGTVSSNTLYFEERGWRCLCIEPNPQLFAQLRVNRKEAQNVAVSDSAKSSVPFSIVTLVGGDVTAISALELDSRLVRDHQIRSTEIIQVTQKTLDICLAESNFNRLDFASIDTEGTELSVLRGFSLLTWRPKLLVVENNYNDPEIENYLSEFGYRKDKRIVVNDFYVKD